MNKKDYKAIAEIIRGDTDYRTPNKILFWKENNAMNFIIALANHFEKDDFNREQFLNDCGVK